MAWPYSTEIVMAAAEGALIPARVLLAEVGGDAGNAVDLATATAALDAAVVWSERYIGGALRKRTYRSRYWCPRSEGLALEVVGSVQATSLLVKQGAGLMAAPEPDVFVAAGWLVYRAGFLPWTANEVTVDYTVGYVADDLPGDIGQALLGLGALFYTRRDRPTGVLTADIGGISRLVYRPELVPQWVTDLLARYRRETL